MEIDLIHNQKILRFLYLRFINDSLRLKLILITKAAATTAHLYKKPNHWKITIQSKYTKQYDAGGDDGIIDGQHGTTNNWRSGNWQGYQGQDF